MLENVIICENEEESVGSGGSESSNTHARPLAQKLWGALGALVM